MKKIAIFASGAGTNAENIIRYFNNSNRIKVVMIFTNNPNATVIDRAQQHHIPYKVFSRFEFTNHDNFLKYLIDSVDYLVLAGYLWLIPKHIIDAFPNRIINIHPALLPKFGGKGMFGIKVHQAVMEHQEKETGITIHFVNEQYDAGAIIFQQSFKIEINDTVTSITQKVHQLEYEYYPKVIEKVILKDEF